MSELFAPDYRALCAELLRGLDENRHPEVRYPGHIRLVMAAARERLAQPEPEGPELTDSEIVEHLIAAGCDALEGESDGTGRIYFEGWHDQVIAGIRAVITANRARWGRLAPQPPASGEVAELAA